MGGGRWRGRLGDSLLDRRDVGDQRLDASAGLCRVTTSQRGRQRIAPHRHVGGAMTPDALPSVDGSMHLLSRKRVARPLRNRREISGWNAKELGNWSVAATGRTVTTGAVGAVEGTAVWRGRRLCLRVRRAHVRGGCQSGSRHHRQHGRARDTNHPPTCHASSRLSEAPSTARWGDPKLTLPAPARRVRNGGAPRPKAGNGSRPAPRTPPRCTGRVGTTRQGRPSEPSEGLPFARH